MPTFQTIEAVDMLVAAAGPATQNSETLTALFTEKRVFQAHGRTTAGAGSATVLIQGSLDGTHWVTLLTISLVLATTETTDGGTTDAPWKFVRASLTAIAGTGATVDVMMGG